MRTDFDWRRTVTTLTFCGAGVPLTGLLAWGVYLVQSNAELVYKLTVGTIILLGIVLIGLSFTVAMRQISGSILGSSFSASGGEEESTPVVTTTTTTTAVTPVAPATEQGS